MSAPSAPTSRPPRVQPSIGYCSSSLGAPPSASSEPAPLMDKLRAIAAAGFDSIELAMSDLQAYATSKRRAADGGETEAAENDWETLKEAAGEVGQACTSLGLRILVLQPFGHFEGWPEGSEERARAWESMRGWVGIAHACGTDMIQVGSSDVELAKLEGGGRDLAALRQRVVADLHELGAFLARQDPPLRVGYEPWCWSTHAPKWSDCASIVREVGLRGTVGLCLDTFQIAGAEFADPTTKSGYRDLDGDDADQDGPSRALQAQFQDNLRRLTAEVAAEDIFFLQVSDAYRPGRALGGRREWSDAYRPVPYTRGGYLPVSAVLAAVLGTGFAGPCTLEVFDDQRAARHTGQEATPASLEAEAAEGMASWQRLLEETLG